MRVGGALAPAALSPLLSQRHPTPCGWSMPPSCVVRTLAAFASVAVVALVLVQAGVTAVSFVVSLLVTGFNSCTNLMFVLVVIASIRVVYVRK